MPEYLKRTWLNPESSTSTGSVVACSTTYEDEGEVRDWNFLEVSDCKGKIKLHQAGDETKEDFLKKLNLLKSEIELFIDHLEKN